MPRDSDAPEAPRRQEARLIELVRKLSREAAREWGPGRLLCNSAGRGQLAKAYAAEGPERSAVCLFQDLFAQRQALLPACPERVSLLCAADPPEEAFTAAALCVSKQGEAELTRDLLQSFYERLPEGGALLSAVDSPTDRWLHEQLQALFPKVTRLPDRETTAYVCVKRGKAPKRREFACEFPFRDGERLIRLRTRPGVFSHRQLDPGARALLEVVQVAPGERVLDLGCGAGAVGVALGLRAEAVSVLAFDSMPRALASAAWAAEQNGLKTWQGLLDCDGAGVPAGQFDVAATNPPYYSNFRIAELFVRTTSKGLRPGGRLAVVTKTAEWYLENLPRLGFRDLAAYGVRSYQVLTAVRG